jgi:protein gp37
MSITHVRESSNRPLPTLPRTHQRRPIQCQIELSYTCKTVRIHWCQLKAFCFIQQVFDVMRRADWHTFQVLTKRAERLQELDSQMDWLANVWMGVSVENQDYTYRIDHLRQTHARIKFLSLEPLLGPLPRLNLKGINWAIVGGESGPGARPLLEEWVIDIRDQCKAKRVPFFFKQWGGVQKKRAGRMLQGQTWDEMPALPNRLMA